MQQGLWGLLGDKDWLTAPAFKELFSWETEPLLATYPAVTCTEPAQGVKYASCEYQKNIVQAKLPELPMYPAFILSMYNNTCSTENLASADRHGNQLFLLLKNIYIIKA